ncbi:MAG: efflux RND transporter periplasmic adaptor subunit [Proteobacteria bacterium]|nr:efflux RND transporter periplasmic adaptor subunit [Pseudomonadota bacterium]
MTLPRRPLHRANTPPPHRSSVAAARDDWGSRRDALPWRLALALAFTGAAIGCHRGPPAPTAAAELPTARVRVQQVLAQSHEGREEVMGTVRAKLRASIEAKVSGRILKLPVALGQRVAAGALLARLDVREIQARVAQVRAVAEQAAGDLARVSALLAQQAITRQDFDAAQARARVAEASVREASTMLGYATLTAPFAGVVTRKLADVGDLASPGRALIELEDPSALRLEIDVPETLIEHVRVGVALPVRIDTLPELLQGTVTEVAPGADPNSRTFRAQLDFAGTPPLRSGQFGRALVPTGHTNILRLPSTAVVERGQLELVFVVHDQRAELRLVKTGKRFGSMIELVSGVSAGETVVVTGAAALVDGQPLEQQR